MLAPCITARSSGSSLYSSLAALTYFFVFLVVHYQNYYSRCATIVGAFSLSFSKVKKRTQKRVATLQRGRTTRRSLKVLPPTSGARSSRTYKQKETSSRTALEVGRATAKSSSSGGNQHPAAATSFILSGPGSSSSLRGNGEEPLEVAVEGIRKNRVWSKNPAHDEDEPPQGERGASEAGKMNKNQQHASYDKNTRPLFLEDPFSASALMGDGNAMNVDAHDAHTPGEGRSKGVSNVQRAEVQLTQALQELPPGNCQDRYLLHQAELFNPFVWCRETERGVCSHLSVKMSETGSSEWSPVGEVIDDPPCEILTVELTTEPPENMPIGEQWVWELNYKDIAENCQRKCNSWRECKFFIHLPVVLGPTNGTERDYVGCHLFSRDDTVSCPLPDGVEGIRYGVDQAPTTANYVMNVYGCRGKTTSFWEETASTDDAVNGGTGPGGATGTTPVSATGEAGGCAGSKLLNRTEAFEPVDWCGPSTCTEETVALSGSLASNATSCYFRTELLTATSTSTGGDLSDASYQDLVETCRLSCNLEMTCNFFVIHLPDDTQNYSECHMFSRSDNQSCDVPQGVEEIGSNDPQGGLYPQLVYECTPGGTTGTPEAWPPTSSPCVHFLSDADQKRINLGSHMTEIMQATTATTLAESQTVTVSGILVECSDDYAQANPPRFYCPPETQMTVTLVGCDVAATPSNDTVPGDEAVVSEDSVENHTNDTVPEAVISEDSVKNHTGAGEGGTTTNATDDGDGNNGTATPGVPLGGAAALAEAPAEIIFTNGTGEGDGGTTSGDADASWTVPVIVATVVGLVLGLIILLSCCFCSSSSSQEIMTEQAQADREGFDPADSKNKPSVVKEREPEPALHVAPDLTAEQDAAASFDFGEAETAFQAAGLTPAFAKRLAMQICDQRISDYQELARPEDGPDLEIMRKLGLFQDPSDGADDGSGVEAVGRLRGFLQNLAETQRRERSIDLGVEDSAEKQMSRTYEEEAQRALAVEQLFQEARVRLQKNAGFSEPAADLVASRLVQAAQGNFEKASAVAGFGMAGDAKFLAISKEDLAAVLAELQGQQEWQDVCRTSPEDETAVQVLMATPVIVLPDDGEAPLQATWVQGFQSATSGKSEKKRKSAMVFDLRTLLTDPGADFGSTEVASPLAGFQTLLPAKKKFERRAAAADNRSVPPSLQAGQESRRSESQGAVEQGGIAEIDPGAVPPADGANTNAVQRTPSKHLLWDTLKAPTHGIFSGTTDTLKEDEDSGKQKPKKVSKKKKTSAELLGKSVSGTGTSVTASSGSSSPRRPKKKKDLKKKQTGAKLASVEKEGVASIAAPGEAETAVTSGMYDGMFEDVSATASAPNSAAVVQQQPASRSADRVHQAFESEALQALQSIGFQLATAKKIAKQLVATDVSGGERIKLGESEKLVATQGFQKVAGKKKVKIENLRDLATELISCKPEAFVKSLSPTSFAAFEHDKQAGGSISVLQSCMMQSGLQSGGSLISDGMAAYEDDPAAPVETALEKKKRIKKKIRQAAGGELSLSSAESSGSRTKAKKSGKTKKSENIKMKTASSKE
ncbi:unnamed protein product [Amoebophrya sp. A120]|nr:unnamed protein product [Amoebophrya sp. A120]|eukprot:GSA120T00010608001.1